MTPNPKTTTPHPDIARLKRIADHAEATLEQSMFLISPRGQSPQFFNDHKTVNRLAELTNILYKLTSVRKTLILLEDPNYFRPKSKNAFDIFCPPPDPESLTAQAIQDLYEAAPNSFTEEDKTHFANQLPNPKVGRDSGPTSPTHPNTESQTNPTTPPQTTASMSSMSLSSTPPNTPDPNSHNSHRSHNSHSAPSIPTIATVRACPTLRNPQATLTRVCQQLNITPEPDPEPLRNASVPPAPPEPDTNPNPDTPRTPKPWTDKTPTQKPPISADALSIYLSLSTSPQSPKPPPSP